MTLDDMQHQVDAWISAHGGYWEHFQILARMTEELGEIAGAPPPGHLMRILVVTSCTGKKTVTHLRALSYEDFARGPEHVRTRETELADALRPARDLLCGQITSAGLPALPGLKPVTLGNPEARRFSCGLIALKGEIAARLLGKLAETPDLLATLIRPEADVLDLLDGGKVRE